MKGRFDHTFTAWLPAHPIQGIRGAAFFVIQLRNQGWSVAFATGGLRAASRAKLRTVGIPFTEECLITASEYLSREEIVSAAVEAAMEGKVAVRPTIISVGDGLWDLLTAQALNLRFIGVGKGAKAQILADRGMTVLPDFSDIQHCLDVVSTRAIAER